ncbi:Quinoprotein alcohol dehydrogenase-like superfamily [Trinorchestia longiramus]|nr:Quinoprotein alcohol dehydrogenase-like superfamily [Trinorchestia longiramus]
MELQLSRVDYQQVGLTAPKCLKILPASVSRAQQKVVVGDSDGLLQLFSMKRGALQLGFKTVPGKAITRLELGGALNTAKDKIFVSAGNEVRGYTKKGKQFLGFDTNLAEEIQSMHVSGSDLLVCGNYVYSHFKDCQDANDYLCPDKIADVISLPAEKVRNIVPVLAGEDRLVRVLEDNEVLYSVELPGTPSALHLFYGDAGETGDLVLYGTTDGRIGLIQLGRGSASHRWVCDASSQAPSLGASGNGGATTTAGGITCMDHHDMTGDGVKDLIIGRDGGAVQVFSYEDGDEMEPTLRFTTAINESVTSVQGGVVGNADYDEIIASTYTGWVFGLTTEPVDRHVTSESGVVNLSSESREKIDKLRQEVEELQQIVAKEREAYQSSTQSAFPGISAVPTFSVNEKMALSCPDASYLLSLEVQTAIDNVLLQSDVPIDLLDVERNASVVSYSTCDPDSGNFLLATYRCQANTTRLEVRIRTIEGQYGTLQAYITPRLQPKCCQVRQFRIKPLSLHSRIHNFDTMRPVSVLTLRGKFTLPEMHAWVSFCLPELPERAPSTDSTEFTFISTFLQTQVEPFLQTQVEPFLQTQVEPFLQTQVEPFLQTQVEPFLQTHVEPFLQTQVEPFLRTQVEPFLQTQVEPFLRTQLNCRYQAGEAVFKSDNISTISILKDVLTKEATRKKVQLTISCEVNEESVVYTLNLLHPKLQAQLFLAKQVSLIDALRELEAHESDTSFLSPEYQYILDNADTLQQQYLKQPCHLERLYGMITDLYIDKYKFKGINVKSRVPQLLEILDNYSSLDLQHLISFFQAT